MSSVPYIFANQNGNIPLSQLDDNFADVKASVDFALDAGNAVVATTAGTVTTAAQPNITSVGSTLSVSGNLTAGNVITTSISMTGNISASNVVATANLVSVGAVVTGNVSSGNLLVSGVVNTTGNVSGGNLVATANLVSVGAVVTGNVSSGNLLTEGLVLATGNVSGGNLVASANLVSVGAVVTGNVSGGNLVASANLVSVGAVVTGNVSGGNLLANGVVTATGNIIGGSKALIGVSSTTLTNPVAVFSGAGASYDQVAIVNTTGTGSADLAVYGNNGTDAQAWSDIGFTGNAFNDSNYTITGANDGYLFVQGNASAGGNLVVATGNIGTTRDIVFSFGFLSANEFLRFQRSSNTVLPYSNATVNIGGASNYVNNLYSANVFNPGLTFVSPNYANITANAANTSLSTTTTVNILIANNTGYTHTVNMPANPANGQLTSFSISGNTVTLVVGTGTVTPTFAGSATAGTSYTYVYRNSNTTWYRIK